MTDTIDQDIYACGNCGNEVKEEDAFFDDDGDMAFCSYDCKREFRQDRAAERSEQIADSWD